MKKIIKSLYIAVDGSSASGKTTASKIISKEFKLKLLSSGKLYRYIAYKIIKNKNRYNSNIIKKFSKSISEKNLNSKKLYNQNITNLSSIIAKKRYINTGRTKSTISTKYFLVLLFNTILYNKSKSSN